MNPIPFKFFAKASKNQIGEVHIYGNIGESIFGEGVAAKDFVASLQDLKKQGSKDLCIYISSMGGNVFEGMTIYNAIARWEGKKTIVIDGLAASAASLICMAADTIQMSDASMMMIHEPRSFAMGTMKDMDSTKDRLLKIRDSMADVYSTRTGRDVEDVKKMMASETWMTAKEAIKEKFADEMITRPSDDEEEMKAVAFVSDLWTQFQHVPPAFFAMAHHFVPERRLPPPEEKKMELAVIARMLGLAENASESAVFAMITQLGTKATSSNSDLQSFLALTGKETVGEARGVILAWQASHKQVEVLSAEKLKLEASVREREVSTIVATAITDGKIPPAMKEFWIAEGNKNVETLKAFVASAPKLVADPIDPRPTDPSAPNALVVLPQDEQEKIFTALNITDPKVKEEARARIAKQTKEWAAGGVKITNVAVIRG